MDFHLAFVILLGALLAFSTPALATETEFIDDDNTLPVDATTTPEPASAPAAKSNEAAKDNVIPEKATTEKATPEKASQKKATQEEATTAAETAGQTTDDADKETDADSGTEAESTSTTAPLNGQEEAKTTPGNINESDDPFSGVSMSPADPDPSVQQNLVLLNSTVAPGTFRTLQWSPGQYISSLDTPVPVLVAHGNRPGPTLCITAAIHGDEINGIEIVRRVLHQIEPDELSGTVIGVPIVNLDGFRRASRYLADRRDLNRYFPGNPTGSYATRIAHSLFQNIILKCDYLVDLHTASFYRTNQPQLRGDLKNNSVLEFSRHFGGMSVLHNNGATGTLRRAATNAGIPALTMETGGPHALEQEAVLFGVRGLKNLLHNLTMYKTMRLWLIPQPVFYQSIWVRSTQGGIMLSKVELNDKVKKGQVLGRVIDPITNTSSDIISPINGSILGKALDQVVSPGFATFHIGVVATEEELKAPLPAVTPEPPATPDGGSTSGSPASDPDEADTIPDNES